METVTTYHGNAQLKADFLREIRQHEQADALLKGTYARMNGHFRGCAIGCSVYSLNVLQGQSQDVGDPDQYADHPRVAKALGFPEWLAYLEDHLFEGLPDHLSKAWPRRLAEALPVGAVVDDAVLAKILVWSLLADTYGVIHATEDVDIKGWITTIANAITAEANGTLTADQREAAALDALDALEAWDALAAWDAWAARAAWAAWAARDAWPSSLRDGFYPALSEYVLSVLRDLPVSADVSMGR